MSTVLNLINTISDEETERLYEPIDDDSDKQSGESQVQPIHRVEHRRLVLFISHTHDLVAFGFLNENLVWFSYTKTDDLFLSRRIFDCMKVSAFYRKTTPERALAAAGLIQRDLLSMCRVDALDIEKSNPVLTGCITIQPSDDKSDMTGEDFAKLIAVCPTRLESNISNIGTIDDILLELEKDYQKLESLYDNDKISSQEKNNKATALCDKWRRAVCLNMSDRATLRDLYRDVCYYEKAVEIPSVMKMLAASV